MIASIKNYAMKKEWEKLITIKEGSVQYVVSRIIHQGTNGFYKGKL